MALTTACSNDGGAGVAEGDLGFATFRWQCAGSGDVACVSGKVADFPRSVAVGAEAEASFVLGADLPRALEAGRLALVGPKVDETSSSDGSYGYEGEPEPITRFRAREPGEVTLLAMAQDETVADHVMIVLREVSSLAVVRDCRNGCPVGLDGEAAVQGTAGDQVALRVEPYGDGLLLVGNVEYQWESLTPEVATVAEVDGNVATLELRREGTAYVRVAGGGAEDTVAIAVASDGPRRRKPGEPGDTGTSTGAGSEGSGTDTDTDTDTDTGSGTDTDAGTTTGGMR